MTLSYSIFNSLSMSGIGNLLNMGLSLIPGGGIASGLLGGGSGIDSLLGGLGGLSNTPQKTPKPVIKRPLPVVKRNLPKPTQASSNQIITTNRGGVNDLELGLKQQEDVFKKYALPVGLGIGGLVAIYMITNKGKK